MANKVIDELKSLGVGSKTIKIPERTLKIPKNVKQENIETTNFLSEDVQVRLEELADNSAQLETIVEALYDVIKTLIKEINDIKELSKKNE